jgi:hypothetical protein
MPLLWRRNHSEEDGRPPIASLCLFLLVATVSITGARAQECPAFPPPVIKFTPIASVLTRDISKTALELADGSARPVPAGYGRSLSGATAQSISLQKMPDGSFCAAIHEVEFKLGLKRTIYVAREFADQACVADTVADLEMPIAVSDEETLARFGASIPQTYAAEIAAIGAVGSPSEDTVKKPLMEKLSAVLKDKIAAGFSQEISAATAKIDMTRWQKEPCGGATDKAFASIHAMPSDYSSGSWQALLLAPQRPGGGMSMGMGMGMGMSMGMGGR